MKKWFFLVIILLPLLTNAQKLNNKTIDPKRNNEMLIGYCNRSGFETINSNFDSCYLSEYSLYHPDSPTLQQIKTQLKGVKITLVLGTWCGDSKEWVPRFYKILDEIKFKPKNLTVIAVDRSKNAEGTHVNTLQIERVPTFIFYRGKTEIGRIIETPEGLLEQHILKILKSK